MSETTDGSNPDEHDSIDADQGDSPGDEHDQHEEYDLEPAVPVEEPGDGPGANPPATTPPDADGVDLACPACGEAMPGSDQVVCLVCGHDLVTGRKVGETPEKPTPGVAGSNAEADSSEETDDEAIAGSDHLVWLIVAGVAVVLTLFAILAGWSSLFASTDGRYADSDGAFTLDAPRIAVRLAAVIRFMCLYYCFFMVT